MRGFGKKEIASHAVCAFTWAYVTLPAQRFRQLFERSTLNGRSNLGRL